MLSYIMSLEVVLSYSMIYIEIIIRVYTIKYNIQQNLSICEKCK